jgi:penicillin-binding protein 1A
MPHEDGSERAPPRPHARTAAAGRDFFRALGADLSDLAGRARERLARRRRKSEKTFLQRRPRRRATSLLIGSLKGLAALAVVGGIAVAGLLVWSLHGLPLDTAEAEAPQTAILIEAADGSPLGRIGHFKIADAKRSEFPDHLVDAVLSIEDRRFHSHFGIDPRGIFRAARRNMQAGEIVEGGSTITQQLVKMQLVDSERTYARKLREAAAAVWLERRLAKDEILTRYLNRIYMGASAYGMPAAARLYFDKSVSEVTLAEAAMLAGLIRAPSQYNPIRDLDLAQRRSGEVLDAMVANGVIDAAEAERARAEPATLNRPEGASEAGSWFADWAAEQASALAGSFNGNLRVRTTLVPSLQKLAEATIEQALGAPGAEHGISQAALVAMRPDGAVLAMVGGRDYGESQFNRAVQAERQPGSAFKLFVYLAALRNGYRPEDIVDASPIGVDGWEPENFGGREYGRMTLADAFAQSVNTAAARLAQEVGIDAVVQAAKDLGIDADLPAHPSLSLGAAEVSLLDLTGAYASVPAGVAPIEPWGISAFAGDEQEQLYTMGPAVEPQQSLAPHHTQLIGLLENAVRSGTGRAAALDGFAAGKTGTSQNHRDAWFIGFDENLVVGVWVGNDDGAPMDEVTGGSLPATIWKTFVTSAGPLVARTGPLVATSEGDWAFDEPAGAAAPGRCDYQACAAKYRSFRASDCTYQPYSGGRKLCEILADPEEQPLLVERFPGPDGEPSTELLPQQSSPLTEESSLVRESLEQVEADEPLAPLAAELTADGDMAAASGLCDVAACSAEYSSFDAADCTYQPFGGGPRRLCEIGAGADASLVETEPASEDEIESIIEEDGALALEIELQEELEEGGAVPRECNFDACAAEYSSFDPSDCSYQPFDGGPRRQCDR